jgi:hypothetical protein
MDQAVQEEFFLDCLTLENGADKLSRNVGNQLPTYVVQHPRRAETSTLLQRKSEISPAFVAPWWQFERLACDIGLYFRFGLIRQEITMLDNDREFIRDFSTKKNFMKVLLVHKDKLVRDFNGRAEQEHWVQTQQFLYEYDM